MIARARQVLAFTCATLGLACGGGSSSPAPTPAPAAVASPCANTLVDRSERIVEETGHTVFHLANGADAWVHLQTHFAAYDLLILDVNMPGLDGIELAQKAQALTPAPKVMFITGFAAVALQANDAVPDARLLSKPFHLKDLVAQVDAMFAGAGKVGNG